MLLCNYLVKMLSIRNHRNAILLNDNDTILEYQRRPTVSRPAIIRALELLGTLGEERPNLMQYAITPYAPWILCDNIDTVLDISAFSKNETSNIVYRMHFRETIGKYPDATIIYTDGSKTERGTASAMFVNQKSYAWRHSDITSVYVLELYAIWHSLIFCEYENTKQVVICSDSLSAMHALVNKANSVDPLICIIKDRIQYLLNINIRVTLIWIPGHAGIAGNVAVEKKNV
ncbi:uncharacterized protein LOC116172392 [Photinus pyralis]|uniref:uncharacterized protein LOC116172392 n=1 Tax=Photinus pyralis TaxID=7054 RepID=UPI001267652B|nr:uncharacterized protein LOC116172392 [Photinus pyralis]